MILHGFELVKEREIPELNMRARLFRHQKTGARLFSMENEDENKVFAITFRTPPVDSTGVAHILEHSVLGGSRKYPVKEPFRELAKGSLNTFLNAFTYPDRTCYPVASQNLQDFYNLIDVYVDSVFHPLIPPESLQQEGWRYDLENPDAPLTYKGVVFNEMKGNYSSPDMILVRSSQQLLFPSHTYGVDSGGNPRFIPDLTYAQFKEFHETYYHPSNAFIYFYGDDDPEERLRLMDGYLQEFEPLEVDSSVAPYQGDGLPARQEIPYDAGDEPGRKSYLTLNWLLPETADPEMILAHGILAHILVGTPASPLRKALIDSGLGEDLAGVGLEDELRQMFFSTGLKGIAAEQADSVEKLILDTLERLAQDGIDPDMITASVNTVEFRLRENNTGSYPRGLILMLRALTGWLYDRDALAPLAFEAPLANIKARLAAGEPVFENLIRASLLENQRRTRLLLKPDPQLRQREELEEQERLAQARAAMSPANLQEIIAANQRLKERQDAPDSAEALAAIPSLKLEDLDREIKKIPLEIQQQGPTEVFYHDLFTNGIVYLDLGFDLHSLPQEDLLYAPLLGRALLEMGTEGQDYVKLSQRIGRSTGGIYPTTFTTTIRATGGATAWLFLRGKATTAQGGELLKILQDVLLTARLDNQDRFRQIVLEEKAGLEAQLTPMGHRMVNTRLRSRFSLAGWAAEAMGGVSFLFFLRRLAEEVDQDWPSVLAGLERVRKALIGRRTMLANVTLDAANWSHFQPALGSFLDALPQGSYEQPTWWSQSTARAEGLAIPAKVNFVGKGANLYDLGYPLGGAAFVANNFLANNWLYPHVRMKGGAYGVFGVFDHRSGVYTFLSYRDPNLLSTLEAYDQAGAFLRSLDETSLSRDEITKNIIGVIGDLDAYQLPDAKGFTSLQRHLAGETDKDRQQLRDSVLAASRPDFHRLGEALEAVRSAGQVVVLGSSEAIEAASAENPGWIDVQKVQ